MATDGPPVSRALEVRRIRLHRVSVPLVEPFRISNGSIAEKDAIVVEALVRDISSRREVTGWGEASPMSGSFYSAETPDGAWQALRGQLLPLALEQPLDPGCFDAQFAAVECEGFAKAGLEGALWDATARLDGRPLCDVLAELGEIGRLRKAGQESGAPGARQNRVIASGVAIGIYDTIDALLDRVARYTAEGYQRVKIKIQPGWDIEPVRAVRERYPRLPLFVDANAAYKLADAAVFHELDRFGLLMFEQPLGRNAHEESAELQRCVQTPVCADESAESLEALEQIAAHGAARIVNIKVQRVGGLRGACRMLARARQAGLECWVGTMPELGVASAQGLHFAALGGFAYPTDIEASRRWYTDDIVAPLIEVDEQGFIHVPESPAMGYVVDRAKLERYTVATHMITA